jgi:cation:H+ antiporter
MVSVSLTALVGLGIFLGPKIANWNFLEINVVVWILILGYGMGLRLVYLDQRISARAAADQGIPLVPEHAGSLKKSAVGFVIAATVILFAGPRLASAAATLADLSGLGNSFVGTTFVAISTSLPELVSSLAALRLGAIDLAIGNVFGSNAFNMMLFAPLDIVCKGSLLANVSTTHLITCLTVIICSQVTLMGQLYQGKERSRVLDPNAYLVIALIFASLGMVYAWAT